MGKYAVGFVEMLNAENMEHTDIGDYCQDFADLVVKVFGNELPAEIDSRLAGLLPTARQDSFVERKKSGYFATQFLKGPAAIGGRLSARTSRVSVSSPKQSTSLESDDLD